VVVFCEIEYVLKAKKYAGKERVESTAFDSDEGNDGKEGIVGRM
jgi:hypothetical protein